MNYNEQNNFNDDYQNSTKNQEIIDVDFKELESKNSEQSIMELEISKKVHNFFYLKIILGYFLIIYLLPAVFQIGMIFLYPSIYNQPAIIENQLTPHAESVINLYTQYVVYGFLTIFACIFLKKELFYDLKNQVFGNTIRLFCLGIILIYASNICVNIILNAFGAINSSQNQQSIEGMLGSANSIEKVLYIIVLALLAPLVEELIFRKSLFNTLKKFQLKNISKILLSGLIFGLLHVALSIIVFLTQGQLQFALNELLLSLSYIASGIVFGLIYVLSDENITTTLLIHIVNNLISSLMIVLL